MSEGAGTLSSVGIREELIRLSRISGPLLDRIDHKEGDRLIQLVGQGMQRAARTSDFAARLGGDEFGLLLPETDFEAAENFIGRLRQCLDAEVDRGHSRIGYSAGVITSTVPEADMEIATAMADDLMYEVKRGGKNRWEHRSVDGRATPAHGVL